MRAGARALTASPAPATTAPTSTPSVSASSRARPSSSRLTSATTPSCCSTTTQTSPRLAKDVLLDELVHERVDTGLVGLHHARLALLEHDALDLLDARRRAAQPEGIAFGLEGHVVPLHDARPAHGLAGAAQQAHLGGVALRVQVAVVVAGRGLGDGVLVGHHELDAGRARLVGLAADGEQARQCGGERFEAALDAACGGDAAGPHAVRRDQFVDAAHASDLRVAELL